jgi:SAM-dependent methyltransferase
MRRMVAIGSLAAVMAGMAAWVALRRRTFRGGVPGTLPGGVGSGINSVLNGPLYRRMAARLDLRPGDELLDVACGEGAFLAEHASNVRHVAGLDLSEVKVGLAQRRLADRIAAGTAEVVKGDAGALPWEDGRFTAVSCIDAFPFFPDPERALAEMCRVLRPGGRAVIDMNPTVPEGTESHRMKGPGGEFWAWNDADVQRMLRAAGFDDVTITHVPGTDSRLLNSLSRRLLGTDEETIAMAVKRVPVPAADDARAEEAVAVR